MFKRSLLLLFLICFVFSCSKKEKIEISIEPEQDPIIEMYAEAVDALKKGDAYYAGKKFKEAEGLLTQYIWASKASLMEGYSHYSRNAYSTAIFSLERHMNNYPADKNIAYAHYLIAMCYYETIEDEKRDSGPLNKAKTKFEFVLNEYPGTDFAIDSRFKIELIQDILASKEMYLGRHYIKKGKWIAAINRFKNIVNDYQQTIFIEEALHRLVELNYNLGLLDESQKYANLLGYNYQSSEWYEKTYKIFNKNYVPTKEILKNKNKKSLIDKIKTRIF